MPKYRSRIAGYFDLDNSNNKLPILNGSILIKWKTLKSVVESAAESEIFGVFHNAQTAVPICFLLIALGHLQPPTPLVADNSTAHGFVHNNITMKRSKSWDIRVHWPRDKEAQQHIDVQWERGDDHNADYHTIHHPIKHHRNIRSRYVLDKINTLKQKICAKIDSITTSSVRVRGCISPWLTWARVHVLNHTPESLLTVGFGTAVGIGTADQIWPFGSVQTDKLHSK